MKQQVQQPAPVSRTLQGNAKTSCQASVADVLQAYKKDIAQRQEIEDDDELLQGKFETAQRDELEEDELLQGKFETAQREELEDDELLQGKFETAQRDELDDDELLQGKFETTQRDELEDDELIQGKFETTQRKEASNNTGLPDNLKSGVEQLSGLDMSDVKVHYNSSKPAGVQAYAYTQGTDIHVAPGQEKHLGHEAWHVAQQKQGRVQPTTTVGGMAVNDNAGLENEADVMGGKAVQMKLEGNISGAITNSIGKKKSRVNQDFGFVENRQGNIIQRKFVNQHFKMNYSTVRLPIQLQPFDEGRPLHDGINKEFRSTMEGKVGDQYFFRAISENEYGELTKTGQFTRQKSYQGIAPTEEYAAKYFGVNQSHYLIEFKVADGINLVDEFKNAGTGQKAEDGLMSLGLGLKVTPVNPNIKADGGDYFMYCLKNGCIRWRLIRFIGEKLPSIYRG